MTPDQIETARTLLNDPDASLEVMQIIPFGRDRCLALFEFGSADHSVAQSFIFDIAAFNPESAVLVLCKNVWMTSLAAAPPHTAFALEVGSTVWSLRQSDWQPNFDAKTLMNRLWAFDDSLAFLVGQDGIILRYNGRSWAELEDGDQVNLNDVHGLDRNRIALVGDMGSLQIINGDSVDAVDIPLEDDLLCVNCGTDGLLRIGGRNGVAAEVLDDELRLLSAPETDIFCVSEFKRQFIWGDADFGLYVQQERELVPFKNVGMGYDLRTDGEVLYCSGADRIWRYDGSLWKSLIPVFDTKWKLRT